ncbi:MAG: MBL fold metallo-hydrolase [Bdellovibrionota bacterium]
MLTKSTGKLYPNLFMITYGNSCHYLLKAEHDLILFDPGLTAHVHLLPKRLEQLGFQASRITKIVLTHLDPHRIGGIPALRDIAPMAKLAASPAQISLLENQNFIEYVQKQDQELSQHFFSAGDQGIFKREKYFTRFLVEEEIRFDRSLPLGAEASLQAIQGPGHTVNSICFYIRPINVVIADDGLGYFRGEQLPGPAADYSIEANKLTLARILELDIEAICLPHFGALSGDAARSHIKRTLEALENLVRECNQAIEIGVKAPDIKQAIKESFYQIEKWDPIAEDSFERSLDSLCKQISEMEV